MTYTEVLNGMRKSAAIRPRRLGRFSRFVRRHPKTMTAATALTTGGTLAAVKGVSDWAEDKNFLLSDAEVKEKAREMIAAERAKTRRDFADMVRDRTTETVGNTLEQNADQRVIDTAYAAMEGAMPRQRYAPRPEARPADRGRRIVPRQRYNPGDLGSYIDYY